MKYVVYFVFAACLYGQGCLQTVLDDAKVLSSGQTIEIENAAKVLTNAGAEVHIVTLPLERGASLDTAERGYESACPTWRAVDGGRRNTLLVFAVAPFAHKSGIYYGGAWDHALGSGWLRVQTQYMNPRFRDGDWTSGIVAGINQTAKIITVSTQELTHVQTVVNQSADLSGLWAFLLWSLIAVVGLIIVVGVIRLYRYMKEQKDRLATEQTSAISAKHNASVLLNEFRTGLDTAKANNNPHAPAAEALFDSALAAYSKLADSVSCDPEQVGLGLSRYTYLLGEYKRIQNQVKSAVNALAGLPDTQRPTPNTATASNYRVVESRKSKIGSAQPIYVPTTVTATYGGGTIVGNDFLTGLIVGEELNKPHYESPPVYIEPEPERSSSWGGLGDSSSSGGGGSTDFGSSSSDYGSSSDFGSSSGGGGSSDW